MASFNRIILIGNLTRDPEVRAVGGSNVCRLGLASNRTYKHRQTGAVTQEVCFVDIDVWGPQADHCKQYLQKGSPVLIEGRLKFDQWKEADGQARSKHSIVADRVVFLRSAPGAEGDGAEDSFSAPGQGFKPQGPAMKAEPFEDELPF